MGGVDRQWTMFYQCLLLLCLVSIPSIRMVPSNCTPSSPSDLCYSPDRVSRGCIPQTNHTTHSLNLAQTQHICTTQTDDGFQFNFCGISHNQWVYMCIADNIYVLDPIDVHHSFELTRIELKPYSKNVDLRQAKWLSLATPQNDSDYSHVQPYLQHFDKEDYIKSSRLASIIWINWFKFDPKVYVEFTYGSPKELSKEGQHVDFKYKELDKGIKSIIQFGFGENVNGSKLYMANNNSKHIQSITFINDDRELGIVFWYDRPCQPSETKVKLSLVKLDEENIPVLMNAYYVLDVVSETQFLFAHEHFDGVSVVGEGQIVLNEEKFDKDMLAFQVNAQCQTPGSYVFKNKLYVFTTNKMCYYRLPDFSKIVARMNRNETFFVSRSSQSFNKMFKCNKEWSQVKAKNFKQDNTKPADSAKKCTQTYRVKQVTINFAPSWFQWFTPTVITVMVAVISVMLALCLMAIMFTVLKNRVEEIKNNARQLHSAKRWTNNSALSQSPESINKRKARDSSSEKRKSRGVKASPSFGFSVNSIPLVNSIYGHRGPSPKKQAETSFRRTSFVNKKTKTNKGGLVFTMKSRAKKPNSPQSSPSKSNRPNRAVLTSNLTTQMAKTSNTTAADDTTTATSTQTTATTSTATD